MGTNYYVRLPECPNPCAHCSGPQDIHLGKSSMGWTFTFRAHPDRPEPVTDFASWLKLLDLGDLRDEYGAEVARGELLERIENKRGGLNTLHGIDYLDADGNRFIPQEFS